MDTLSAAPHSAVLRGVSTPTNDARILEQRIALWVVIIPFLALIAGIVLLLRSAVGRVEVLLLED